MSNPTKIFRFDCMADRYNGCHEYLDVLNHWRPITKGEAEKYAREMGWSLTDAGWFCPNCVAAKRREK